MSTAMLKKLPKAIGAETPLAAEKPPQKDLKEVKPPRRKRNGGDRDGSEDSRSQPSQFGVASTDEEISPSLAPAQFEPELQAPTEVLDEVNPVENILSDDSLSCFFPPDEVRWECVEESDVEMSDFSEDSSPEISDRHVIDLDKIVLDEDEAIFLRGPMKWTHDSELTPGSRGYYRSYKGLFSGARTAALQPLFLRPVELLANSAGLYWDKQLGCVKSVGRAYRVHDRWRGVNSLAPRLNRHEADALRVDDLLRVVAADETTPLRRRRYYNQLRKLEYMRTIWDAILLSYQQIRFFRSGPFGAFPPSLKRALTRLKSQIVRNPMEVAKTLKAVGGLARSWYFEDVVRPHSVWLDPLTRDECRIFSYIGRGLPPPLKDPSGTIDEFVARVTSQPPGEHPEWRDFVFWYLGRYHPKKTVEYRTDPSVASSLGYTRFEGGLTAAVQALVSFGMVVHAQYTFEEEAMEYGGSGLPAPEAWYLFRDHCSDMDPAAPLPPGGEGEFKEHWGDDIEGDPEHIRLAGGPTKPEAEPQSLSDILDLLDSESINSYYLNVAVRVVLGVIPRVPLLAIYAEEKGLKARLPSTTLAAATLVYQLLRRAMDSHITLDPRFSGPMGGNLPMPNGRPMRNGPGEYYYSQDLSFATDLHPFWLERIAYEELLPHHPRLQWTERYFDKLFGPHAVLVDADSVPTPPLDFLAVTQPVWKIGPYEGRRGEILLGGPNSDLTNRAFCLPRDRSDAFVRSYVDWLKDVDGAKVAITRTSASMGDSTSFPVMPLLTAFAAHRAQTPNLWGAGDDASVAQMTPEKEKIFEQTMVDCGAVLSEGDPVKGKPNKIFRHRRKLNFCEEMFEWHGTASRGYLRRPKFFHTSLWSAPPGGSKGKIDWFNQPSSVLEHAARLGIRGRAGLWQFTKTAYPARAAYQLGVPVGQPVELGGISHPSFATNERSIVSGISSPLGQAWLNKLSQVTKLEWATGTGLSPLPSGQSDLSRSIAREEMARLEALCLPGENQTPVLSSNPSEGTRQNILYSDAADYVMRLITSWEVYHRRAPDEISTPHITVVARKFRQKLKTPVKLDRDLSLVPTLQDVASKKLTYVDSRVSLLPGKSTVTRAYGLLPYTTSKVEKLQFQWERLAQFKIDDAYLIPQEKS